MVYGIWYMVYGIWYMVYGIWCYLIVSPPELLLEPSLEGRERDGQPAEQVVLVSKVVVVHLQLQLVRRVRLR